MNYNVLSRIGGGNYTTSLKGIAIVIIILCHTMGCRPRVFTPLGGIGVAMFLILSGYG